MKYKMKIRSLLALTFFAIFPLFGQTDLPFAGEVKEIQENIQKTWDNSKETIVFTGSSSIRMWNDLQERFPETQILNTGFGGSQSSDLEHFLDELILDYNPSQVFIYEGDNDINSKKSPRAIIGTMEDILEVLQTKNPNMDIVLISAKPSISRWHLKRKYKRFNKRLSKLASRTTGVRYADVWTTMLNKRKLKRDLFIEDGLHMNSKGYDLWQEALKEYVNNTL
ncbi:GDSL-type esterase/lipase family protein [Muricauda sp. 2012CJ35-5]|uniref:GDSL-type esterase/lipase family protein n=1 Tax=Flagellimonas spongiicola TaxID=2942208 RepID=A0ABT0PP71_9FLAO|nr:GDSL-type esterase/lipase family protein [Allomuricauda spongiicola]MCL6272756.1 GDSL-type esterase/lipase family protein [Allomuricauda spongiicola]